METMDFMLLEKPAWLELPEEEKQSHTYWTCFGYIIPSDDPKSNPIWAGIFHNKEEAECHAAIEKASWRWDKNPASPVSLQDVMLKARQKGLAGVKIMGYDSGWVVLKEYPANVPLGNTI